MAATGARARKPVGSAAWIATEKENFVQLVNQEMEEVEYPVRHEMDWLNEHMAEIFSSNQFNLKEAFKTPGKMRGKTPRTARKRDANEARVPLSEIFSASHNKFESKISASPAAHRSPAKPSPAKTAIPTPTKAKNASDPDSQPEYPDLTQNLNSFPQYNTDSGYNGMPGGEAEEDGEDDDMVLTQMQPESQTSTQPINDDPFTTGSQEPPSSVDRRTTSASFHSAQEEVRQRAETAEPMQVDTTPKQSIEVHPPPPHTSLKKIMKQKQEPQEPANESEKQPTDAAKSSPMKPSATQPYEPTNVENTDDKDEMALDNLDDIGSPSDGSTPERPPIRKSSLTFASLPAREPLTKKSLGGPRTSRTSHVDLAKINAGVSGYLGRQTGAHRTTQVAFDETATQADRMDIDQSKEQPRESDTDSRVSKLHNKSSTQRLHEKISMLGKLQPSRPTKSIPSVSGLSSQVTYPELPAAKSDAKRESLSRKSRETPGPETSKATENDDWIKPLESPYRTNISKSQTDLEKRTGQETGSNSEGDVAALNRDQKTNEDPVRPNSRHALESLRGKSSTPVLSSPYRSGHQKAQSVPQIDSYISTTPVGSPQRQDEPLSASKSRLQSIVDSAKGLFTNSGESSAAARLEASSPEEPRLRHVKTDISTLKEAKKEFLPQPESPPRQEGRRTRSSTEREEKRKQREREERQREEEAEKNRQEEKERFAAQEKASKDYEGHEDHMRAPSSPHKVQQKHSKDPEPSLEAPSRTRAQSVSQQPLKQNDRRPLKPTREALQKSKPQPQPVSIRVGSALSRQIPLASSTVSSVTEATATAPTPASTTKQPSIKKKTSNTSLHTAASNSSFKSSVSSQSQRKAQLASERKRENEEREARRKEEQKRDLERKRAARQQEEARRQEMRNRAEAERRERHTAEDPKKTAQMQAIEKWRLENARRLERQGSQQPNDMGSFQQEKSASQSTRELPRPTSRLGSVQPFNRSINPPQPNPAKPPKRGLDEEASRRPATAKPGMMQPSGDKRRRTEDGQNPVTRPTMAPPIRQSSNRKESNIRKEPTKHSIYGLPQASTHQAGSSIFKTAQPQRPAHPMDLSKYASGKIPFAEPANASSKTPGTSSSQKAPKPSPNYPNGENINLPEIATDSEDEDSDAEMLPVPKWAQPKELESLLRQQEGMEVDSIFGPIAPFSLEETFKSDKKIKKFRERTSSANWSGPDGLTQDEIRKDLAERQRLRLNGGWTFGN
ncbi:hypothetical protein BDV59DRAFT_179727 [Aspergillus ambiguus]|uniref:uncharacterized protein n=1 Tax=Aspergillus ambiguus TaxID=176160 RepID=UPI003CCCBF54